MKTCFIYCRVSTEEQADKGYSLETQEKLCREFAERSGYRVLGVYRDEGKSATNLDRAALQELLSRCTKENNVTAVIIQETDRLARNTKDHLTIKAILKKAGTKLISVAQPMLDDSPEGMMIDTILASVNQFQSDINSRKTRRGLQERLNLGWWPGWAPLGYLNVEVAGSEETGKRKTVIKRDPDRWDLVHEGFQLYLTGNYSADEANDILYEKGLRSKTGKKIPHSIIVRTLRNPFYAGLMHWNGQKRQGRHEPMITMDEHKRVLEIIDSHNLHACRRRKHNFLLRGFAFCNICGHRYTGEVHLKKKKAYYHCAIIRGHSNRGQNVEVNNLEREAEEQFKMIQFTERFSQMIVEKLRTVYHQQKDEINSRKQVLYNQKKAIEAKRDKAEEKLFDGVISDDDFVRLRTKFSQDLTHIQEQIDELDIQHSLDIDVVQEVLRLSRNIYKAYKKAPYELKRQYLGLFWDQFLVQDKRIVEAVPTDLIQALERERKVIIVSNWRPSPRLIRTLENHVYIENVREILKKIAELKKRARRTLPSSPIALLACPNPAVQNGKPRYLDAA